MKTIRLFAAVIAITGIVGFCGCAEKSGVQEETKVTTPEGTKTITKETKVETTGNPPAVNTETPKP